MADTFRWRGKRRLAKRPGGRAAPRKPPPKRPCVRVQPHTFRLLVRASYERNVTIQALVSWVLRGLPRLQPQPETERKREDEQPFTRFDFKVPKR